MEVSTASALMTTSSRLVEDYYSTHICNGWIDALGVNDNGADSMYDMMYEWATKLPLEEAASISTVCEGDIEENGETESGDVIYCDADLVPKEFVEQ